MHLKRKTTESVIPNKVNWIRSSVKSFDPENNIVNLIDGSVGIRLSRGCYWIDSKMGYGRRA